MVNLDWKFGYNGVLSFGDVIQSSDMNFNGFYIVASEYGKVTNVCYGNLHQLHSNFKQQYESSNHLKIGYFTFAAYENEEDAIDIQSLLIKSLYHNQEYNQSKKLVSLPKYTLFSEVYKSYCQIYQDKSEALDKFNKLEVIASENDFLDKLECSLFRNNYSKKYEIFVLTTSYYNREFKIIEKLGKGFPSQEKAEQVVNMLKTFGTINDWKPSC